jgi:hypothetical protein
MKLLTAKDKKRQHRITLDKFLQLTLRYAEYVPKKFKRISAENFYLEYLNGGFSSILCRA